MRFIGITGGIGAGKSELLSFIEKHYKCKIYLADKVAFKVREPGTDCYNELVDLLGKNIVDDNKLMAKALFGNDELLAKVNGIIHPAVKDYLLSELEFAKQDGKVELFFVEAALLIEGGYKELVDELWYIYADKDVRIHRLMEARGYSKEKAISIMNNQLSEDEFRRNCDFEINNSGALEDATKQIMCRLEEYTWLN